MGIANQKRQMLARISHHAAQDTDKTWAFWSRARTVKNTACHSSVPITVQAGLHVRKLALHSNRSYGCAFRSCACSRDPGETLEVVAGNYMANRQESSPVFLAESQRAQRFFMGFYLHEIASCFFFAVLASWREQLTAHSGSNSTGFLYAPCASVLNI